MPRRKIELELEVTFLTTLEGGRLSPPQLNGSVYCPKLVIDDPEADPCLRDQFGLGEECLDVAFQSGPSDFRLGEPVSATARSIGQIGMFGTIAQGAVFKVREASHVVGSGRVIARRKCAVSRLWMPPNVNPGSTPFNSALQRSHSRVTARAKERHGPRRAARR
jgi:hypothetical protein